MTAGRTRWLAMAIGTAGLVGALCSGAQAQSDADIDTLSAQMKTGSHAFDDGHDHGHMTVPHALGFTKSEDLFALHDDTHEDMAHATALEGEMADFVRTQDFTVPQDLFEDEAATVPRRPYQSAYRRYPSEPTAIVGATVLTGEGQRLEGATVLLRDGSIEGVTVGGEAPEGYTVIDGTGKWVTPGIIDIHSHLGVYPSPGAQAHSDGNEITGPNTAYVWAEHAVWPQDPGFTRALAGGITSLHILPGSANLFGGRGVTLKNVGARTTQGMKFPEAPHTLKMACGENPKRVYGSRGRSPMTRMGNVAVIRQTLYQAQQYREAWDAYNEARSQGRNVRQPSRNITFDTLAGVLRGDILVQFHCYRADDMANMLDVAKEFGFRIQTFHHAVESYKIADLLREAGTCSAMWADWWGFKLEAYDSIRENAALVHNAGACAIIHSDSDVGIQRLNQEAAKVMADAAKAGIVIPREDVIGWITSNPARALGIGDRTGSLAPGKDADVVVWNGDPFSVYALAEKVFIDGAMMYDREDGDLSPRTDFELGQSGYDSTGGAGQ